MSQVREGGCVCGAVRYRAAGIPKRVSACSCEWCRKRTGSVLGLSVYFEDSDVTFLQGELGTYRLHSDAGRWIDSQFCRNCGTALTWTLEFLPGLRGLAGGTFDNPQSWLKPQRYVFARSKPEWLAAPDGVDIFDGMPKSPQE
jgi:hypothetical protein